VILGAIAEKLKRRPQDDFKGRRFEASLILQAVFWYLRYPLSYRDIEELFLRETPNNGGIGVGLTATA
jgi:transposase, IS6 family